MCLLNTTCLQWILHCLNSTNTNKISEEKLQDLLAHLSGIGRAIFTLPAKTCKGDLPVKAGCGLHASTISIVVLQSCEQEDLNGLLGEGR